MEPDKLDKFFMEHHPYITSTECEFGDHVYTTCSCGYKHDTWADDAGPWLEHIKELLRVLITN